jgi:hypothetical protein
MSLESIDLNAVRRTDYLDPKRHARWLMCTCAGSEIGPVQTLEVGVRIHWGFISTVSSILLVFNSEERILNCPR